MKIQFVQDVIDIIRGKKKEKKSKRTKPQHGCTRTAASGCTEMETCTLTQDVSHSAKGLINNRTRYY